MGPIETEIAGIIGPPDNIVAMMAIESLTKLNWNCSTNKKIDHI